LHKQYAIECIRCVSETKVIKRAFQAGAKGYITKHEVAETIITAIRLMLSSKDYISETMTQKFLKKLNSQGSHC
jgi:DNA-binding NarL/FixJ family response regulator